MLINAMVTAGDLPIANLRRNLVQAPGQPQDLTMTMVQVLPSCILALRRPTRSVECKLPRESEDSRLGQSIMIFVFKRRGTLLLVLGLVSSASWGQQSPTVTLQVAPKDLSIAAGERRQVAVIATVTGSSVRKLKLKARPEPGTRVAIGKSAKLPDEVRGDVSWPVFISKEADGKTSSRIIFEAQYESGDQTVPVPGVVDVALDLTVKQRPKNEEVATATIQTSFDKLEERRPQDVYLLVTNLSDVPLQVTGVTAALPNFVSVLVDGKSITPMQGVSTVYTPAVPAAPVIIPPRKGHLFAMALKIPDYSPVLAGKYLMLFDVNLRYAKDGYSTESSIVASKEFQAGVLGEQEFVGVTSVPFLLLPGFLVVSILAILLSKVWPKWNLELDYKKPEFYLLGIIVSMLIVFVLYNHLSTWIFRHLWKVKVAGRDLMSGYSLADIINIWVIATVLALLPWVLIGGLVRLFTAGMARLQRNKTPTPEDQPLDVLLRLTRANKSFNLNQATVAGQRLWELPLPSPDPAQKWVSGRVSVSFPDGEADTATRFQNLLNDPTKTAELYELLQPVKDKITIAWLPPDQPPHLVDKKDAPTVTGAPEDFVYAG